ncbi:hypothetical protein L6R49_23800 [Myxococcota bacterium]|nr:hypothetical protein [Myxococcota bacterium]
MLSIALLFAALTTTAQADPYMWGVGPTVSTLVFPVTYPGKLPTAVPSSFDFDGARLDVNVGGHAVLYLDGDSRLGLRAGLGGGGGWSNRYIDAEYERVMLTDGKLHMLGGIGLGLGAGSFTDSSEDLLQLNYALMRTQLSGLYRNKNQAYEVGLLAQYHLPLEHRYTPSGGQTESIKGKGSRYGSVGLEATVYFGDFTPPKKKGKRRGGNNGGSRGR